MFPGLPCFFLRSSASVYYTECKPKNKKQGRPRNEGRVWAWDYSKTGKVLGRRPYLLQSNWGSFWAMFGAAQWSILVWQCNTTCMTVWVCTCVYTPTQSLIHAWLCGCVHVHTPTQSLLHAWLCGCVHVYTHPHSHYYMHDCVGVYMCIHTHTVTTTCMTVWVCTCVYTHTVTNTWVPCCLVHVVELCHWIVEHLRERESRLSNESILSWCVW